MAARYRRRKRSLLAEVSGRPPAALSACRGRPAEPARPPGGGSGGSLCPHAPAGGPGWGELASSIARVCWMAVMSPGDALDRVVYLKDRALEESRRWAASGKAGDLVRALGDDENVRRHGEGTLPELPGSGQSTERKSVGEGQGVEVR